MSRRRAALLGAVALLALWGCKDQGAEGASPQAAPALPEPTWPPPGEKAATPPSVEDLMRRLVNRFDRGDPKLAERYFLRGPQIKGLLDCGDVDLAKHLEAERSRLFASVERPVVFEGFGDGYLAEAKRGEGELAGCKARIDLISYRARYTWKMAGKAETREAHAVRVGNAWFFLRL